MKWSNEMWSTREENNYIILKSILLWSMTIFIALTTLTNLSSRLMLVTRRAFKQIIRRINKELIQIGDDAMLQIVNLKV